MNTKSSNTILSTILTLSFINIMPKENAKLIRLIHLYYTRHPWLSESLNNV